MVPLYLHTAAFRYELAGEHTYEFVQGTYPCELPAGKSVSN